MKFLARLKRYLKSWAQRASNVCNDTFEGSGGEVAKRISKDCMRGRAATFEVKESSDGQFYFVLKGGNGEVMATSETYTRRADAHRAVERFRTLVINALVASE